MYSDSRKIHLIEEVLKLKNEALLNELETVLDKKKKKDAKKSFRDFVGIMSKAEANEMMKIIEDGCEKIDYEGWK
jgi:hypothetical protein